MLFGIRESFSDFLREAHTKSEDVPQKLEDLAASGIRLVITDKNDPDGVGFVQWRVAFYVAGREESLGNFMCLLDGCGKQHRTGVCIDVWSLWGFRCF